MKFRIDQKLEWRNLTTFVPNKSLPVYNWFYYKEGFSRDLVFKIIEMFKIRNGKVLDPFCGVGTTNLTCKEKGIDSIGFEVSPLALFSAKVKCRDYDISGLKDTLKTIKKMKFRKPDRSWIPSNIQRYFNTHTLDDILLFRNFVEGIEDNRIKDFFRLGLISSATRCSYMYKDGSVVKLRRHPIPPFKKFYHHRMKRMIKDLKKLKTKECKTIIKEGDARKLKLENESVDFVITSPPYLNKIEYTKIYRVEEFLFFRVPRKKGIRSYIGMKTEPEQIFPDLPDMANAYFSDMFRSLSELYRVCRTGAKLAIVVGNGCFPTRVVESDLLLSELAEKIGFSLEGIYVLNKRWCTRQRVIKVGELRESMLVLKK
jgi:DNA modification methylase